jgi:hypothetical protein
MNDWCVNRLVLGSALLYPTYESVGDVPKFWVNLALSP